MNKFPFFPVGRPSMCMSKIGDDDNGGAPVPEGQDDDNGDAPVPEQERPKQERPDQEQRDPEQPAEEKPVEEKLDNTAGGNK